MKKWHLTGLFICLVIVSIYFLVRFHNGASGNQPVTIAEVSPELTRDVQGASDSECHIRGVLPDPDCTPGAIDASVTQENVFETICQRGYTKTVRPPVSFTNELKKEQIAAYGYTDTNLRDYEEDHLISLELGGSPADPKNLWPEPGGSPNPKDKVENRCRDMVCTGHISLALAQKEIAANWTTACRN